MISPGHCSFTKSPDGQEDWVVYHAARYPGSGWARQVRAQPISGAPTAPRLRPPAPPRHAPALAVGRAGPPAVRGRGRLTQRLGPRDPPRATRTAPPSARSGRLDTAVSFDLTVGDPGSYGLLIRFGNDGPPKGVATHTLTVNDDPPQTVRYVYTGPGRRSNAVARVALKAGANRLRLAKGEGLAEVDCLDVVPDRAEGRGP